MEKVPPPRQSDETGTLRAFLDYYRATLLGQCAGLSAAQLNTTLPPASMTLGGMLKHLAYVEDWWFGEIFRGAEAGAPWADVDWDADHNWDWHSAAEDTPEQLRALFEEAVQRSNDVLDRAASWEALSAVSRNGVGELFSLRWIVVHMLEEYARHAGHADLIRESIDGAVDL